MKLAYTGTDMHGDRGPGRCSGKGGVKPRQQQRRRLFHRPPARTLTGCVLDVRACFLVLTILAARGMRRRSDCHGGCLGRAAGAQRGHQRASDGRTAWRC